MTPKRVITAAGSFRSDPFCPKLRAAISFPIYRCAVILTALLAGTLLNAASAGAQVSAQRGSLAASPAPDAESPVAGAPAPVFESPKGWGATAPVIPDAPLIDAPGVSGDPQPSSSSLAPASLTQSSMAPSSSTQTSPYDYEGKQTKRILGIVPNFRSVSASSHPPAETGREKFAGFARDSFDYSSFIFVGGIAGLNQLANTTPEFHQGAKGYARYYWHNYVDQTDENLWVGFLLPTAFHQDPRYFTLGHGGGLKRTLYSFSRIVITRTDSGGSAFNLSEVLGSGAAAGISNLYYPSKERSFGNTGRQWGLNVGLDGATFIFKEFWPDLNRAFFHQK